jgi:hypothetical protein
MSKLTAKFQNFKKNLNAQIVTVYRECKEICMAAERGDSEVGEDSATENYSGQEDTTTKNSPNKTACSTVVKDHHMLANDCKSENTQSRNIAHKPRGRPRMTSS